MRGRGRRNRPFRASGSDRITYTSSTGKLTSPAVVRTLFSSGTRIADPAPRTGFVCSSDTRTTTRCAPAGRSTVMNCWARFRTWYTAFVMICPSGR